MTNYTRFTGDFFQMADRKNWLTAVPGKTNPESENTPTLGNQEQGLLSPQLEHVFLLLVIKGHFTDGFFQTHRDFAVVGDSRGSRLCIFVETHLLVIYNTINIVPGPEQ